MDFRLATYEMEISSSLLSSIPNESYSDVSGTNSDDFPMLVEASISESTFQKLVKMTQFQIIWWRNNVTSETNAENLVTNDDVRKLEDWFLSNIPFVIVRKVFRQTNKFEHMNNLTLRGLSDYLKEMLQNFDIELRGTIYELEITSLSQFVDHIAAREPTKTILYRGQSHGQSWKLIPKLCRFQLPKWANGWREVEDSLLNRFYRHSRSQVSVEPRSITELMALAQHHGLPTRLLDWTENPLAALHFAVSENQPLRDEFSPVWIGKFGVSPLVESQIEERIRNNKTDIDTIVFRSPTISDRIAAQQGVFTWHPLPETGDFVPLEEQRIQPYRWLCRIKIPRELRTEIRTQLDSVGINHFTLFPDLDGLSKKLVWEVFSE